MSRPLQRKNDRGLGNHFRGCGEEVSNRLRKNGLRLLGSRFEVEAFEVGPGAMCVAAAAGGATLQLDAPEMLVAHRERVVTHRLAQMPHGGVLKGKGQTCAHAVAKCPNCLGQHIA